MNPLTLALRQLRREWRSGELAVLIAALVIAVGALSSVSFATDRVRQSVERRAAESLAADIVIRSRNEISESLADAARARDLETARTLEFPSVVTSGERGQLAEIRAVTDGYPLRGQLEISEQAYGPSTTTDELPGPGEVWAEPRLVGALGVDTGAEIRVGAKTFTLTRVISYAPDQGFSFVEIAPMLVMRMDELEGSGLLGPASRVSHRLLIAGERGAIDAYRSTVENELEPGQRLSDIRDARPELVSAINRADQFLNLAALVAVLLAAVAIAMAARRYATRETDTVAILKCLGAQRRDVLWGYLAQLLIIALVAGLAGIVIGYAAQSFLLMLVKDIIGQELPPASLAPAPWSLALGVIILSGFGLPPVLGLVRTSPIRVLRRDMGGVPITGWLVYSIALVAISTILILQTGDLKLSLYVLGGAAGGAILLGSGAAALVYVLNRFRRGVGVAWRFGVASIVRRGRDSIVQVTAFGLGMLVLLLLAVVRTDLRDSWQAMLPEDAPNHFMINIQPDEHDAVREFFRERNVEPPELRAMVRSRLTAINGTPITEIDFSAEGRSQRFAEREQNLSWAGELAESNSIAAGEWWTPDEYSEPLVSLDDEAARRLGVGLGDKLTYDIAGQELVATVDSLRLIEWDSFEPNFFMVVPPSLLENYPATFIGSVHVPSDRAPMMLELVRAYPSVTVIDLDTIIAQVKSVMDQAALAVEYIFLFTLAAGVLVLLAAVQSTRDERRFESAMLRTLGATQRTVISGVVAEFLLLGLLAAALAVVAASVSGWLLATEVGARRALVVAAAPTLLVSGAVNWDLPSLALATAGLVAHRRGHDGWTGVWLGLGTAAKLWPGLALVALVPAA
ncbi:MAG: FtsX-like permease family protein, partial [Proteobacteria bacterium]|nr:FtsX-like permease family protein [Pseudomonadota bacterium]